MVADRLIWSKLVYADTLRRIRLSVLRGSTVQAAFQLGLFDHLEWQALEIALITLELTLQTVLQADLQAALQVPLQLTVNSCQTTLILLSNYSYTSQASQG